MVERRVHMLSSAQVDAHVRGVTATFFHAQNNASDYSYSHTNEARVRLPTRARAAASAHSPGSTSQARFVCATCNNDALRLRAAAAPGGRDEILRPGTCGGSRAGTVSLDLPSRTLRCLPWHTCGGARDGFDRSKHASHVHGLFVDGAQEHDESSVVSLCHAAATAAIATGITVAAARLTAQAASTADERQQSATARSSQQHRRQCHHCHHCHNSHAISEWHRRRSSYFQPKAQPCHRRHQQHQPWFGRLGRV